MLAGLAGSLQFSAHGGNISPDIGIPPGAGRGAALHSEQLLGADDGTHNLHYRAQQPTCKAECVPDLLTIKSA